MRGHGATAARLTPDQKVGSSNLSALTLATEHKQQFACICGVLSLVVCAWDATVARCVQVGDVLPARGSRACICMCAHAMAIKDNAEQIGQLDGVNKPCCVHLYLLCFGCHLKVEVQAALEAQAKL